MLFGIHVSDPFLPVPNESEDGSLMSQRYRYCGKTEDHCLVSRGCQSGCTTPTNNPASTSVAEPVMGAPTGAPPTGQVTQDGNCGSTNGNTVCGDWPQGPCCSLYGVSRHGPASSTAKLNICSTVAKPRVIAVKAAKADHAWDRL
jgi:hypothetical protein